MNKVISFSVWGDNPKYTVGAVRNAELAQEIYPGWNCYFFMGNSVLKDIETQLLSIPNVTIFYKDVPGDWRGMFWRFETSYDLQVDISIFRDTDSRLNMREKYAVDEWLVSDKTFHIMRDHPFHRNPILGGMWGYKKNDKYPIRQLLQEFEQTNEYGTDYKFFNQKLYPLIGNDKIVHDPFHEKIDFPQPRVGTEFVGDVFDKNDNRHPEFWKFIK